MLIYLFRKAQKSFQSHEKVFFHGGFRYGFGSLQEASNFVSNLGLVGYEEDGFIQKLRHSAGLVRDGKAKYERDTVIFDRIQISWEFLASLLLISHRKNRLEIVDFGGGLGTSFRQNISLLNLAGIQTTWTVVEQPKLVEIGKQEFEKDSLKFTHALSDLEPTDVDAVIFGGSLGYLSEPFEILRQTFVLSPSFILFDRTGFIENDFDEIAVQFVPESIYKAAYPVRIFSISNFESFMNQEYELIQKWECLMQPDSASIALGSLWRKRIK